MKGKQLALLLVVLVALGGVWYLLAERNHGAWSDIGAGGGKVVDFPLNDVTRVLIKSTTGEVNLEKKGDAWTVRERAGYPADFDKVSRLLRALWELKPVQEVKVGPSQLPRLELVEPDKGGKAGTLVQLIGADGKPINGLLLGKKYLRKNEGNFGGPPEGYPAGRYVKRENGVRVSLVSQTLDEAEPKPEPWLSKDFVKIEEPKSITAPGWTATRDSISSEWKFADAKPDEKLDPNKTSAFGSILSAPVFSDVLAPEAKLDEPITAASVETFDGFHYDLKLGKPNGENQSVQIKVSATFPTARTPEKDEKPDDKKRLDDEFAQKLKGWQEKLAKEKKVESRLYTLPWGTLEAFSKDRASFLAPKPTPTPVPTAVPTPTPAPVTPTPVPPTPTVTPTPTPTPTAVPATPTPEPTAIPVTPTPISVTTPPISVTTPPLTAPTPPPTPTPAAD